MVYVKDTLYLSVLPRNLDDLQQNIATDIALIDIEMLEKILGRDGISCLRMQVTNDKFIEELRGGTQI